MKVLVTGATGFTGSYVIPLLLQQGIQVSCFIRSKSDTFRLPVEQVELIYGDLNNSDSLKGALNNKDILINIASLGSGHAPNIVKAALEMGIKRTIFISSTSIFTSFNVPSKAIRMSAEEAIANSGLSYTILRPTMIYGSPRDRNMFRLIQYLQKWPAIPVIGKGENLQQPVYVGDVARAVMQCLSSDRTYGKTYNIPGGQALTYNTVIDTICALLKRQGKKVHFPVKPVVRTLRLFEKIGLFFPIKAEQILRLNEDKMFDFSKAHNDFGYSPISFEEGIGQEIEEMRLTGLI